MMETPTEKQLHMTEKEASIPTDDVSASDAIGEVAVVEESKEVKHRYDPSTEFLKLHPEWADYTAADAKKVVRKIDFIVFLLWITTMIAAVDKIVISNAKLYGMADDTHLVGQQYSWVGSIFYFGFLVAEFPSAFIIQKLPVGKLLSCTVMAWAVVVMLLGTTKNAAGLMTLRFIMGMCEAPLNPCCSIITVMWYTKREQPVRTMIWFSGFSSLFTGIVSYGIGHTHTKIAPWRLLFIVLGAFTFLWGIVLFFFLPDSPLKNKLLSDREKYIAIDRIKENQTGIENKEIKWYQVREALTDWKTWVICLFSVCMNVPTGGLVTFAAQIVSGLGYGKLQTTLLGMPTGVFQTAAAVAVAVPSYFTTNKRCLFSGLCCLIPLTCSILIRRTAGREQDRIACCVLLLLLLLGRILITLPMANTSGHTKKLTVNCMIFGSYCIANIIAPQFFLASQAPGYATGYNAILGFEVAAILCMIVYAIGSRMENKRRDRIEGVNPVHDILEEDDLTDKEKIGFRYIY